MGFLAIVASSEPGVVKWLNADWTGDSIVETMRSLMRSRGMLLGMDHGSGPTVICLPDQHMFYIFRGPAPPRSPPFLSPGGPRFNWMYCAMTLSWRTTQYIQHSAQNVGNSPKPRRQASDNNSPYQSQPSFRQINTNSPCGINIHLIWPAYLVALIKYCAGLTGEGWLARG